MEDRLTADDDMALIELRNLEADELVASPGETMAHISGHLVHADTSLAHSR